MIEGNISGAAFAVCICAIIAGTVTAILGAQRYFAAHDTLIETSVQKCIAAGRPPLECKALRENK